MTEGPITRDGQPFKLGQILVTSSGGVFETSPETHGLSIIEYQGEKFHVIFRKGSGMETDISTFYSSESARLKQMIEDLEERKIYIDDDIHELRLKLASLENP